MIHFSVFNRASQIKKLQTTKFDLAIIGGGVTGAGIALDAASRGLNACLIEKHDFASGTSNKSTKLIHGGLRYLKQFEIGLVRESGTERAIVHKLAPHLVVPEKMLLPLIEGGTYGKIMTSIGLKVYDFLADVNGDDKRLMLNREETLNKEPLLNNNEVLGGGLYAEYRTDDARLTIEILKKAATFGATIINYCEMESFNYTIDSKIKSINCIDNTTGNTFQIKARNYVSATGPWVDKLRAKDHSISDKYLHLTKGVHIVFPHEKLPVKQPIYFDVPDGRMIFAIPRGRITYVGTTDTNYSGNLDRVVVTKDDATYLLNAINNTFPSINLLIDDIESNWAGLRPLIHEENKAPSELSRKDELFISDSGLISIAGGKLTGYRKMAHRAIDAVLKTMKSKHKKDLNKSKTDKTPLVYPSFENYSSVNIYQKELELKLSDIGISDSFHAWYLCSTFGKQSDIIIQKSKEFENKNALERLIRAELWYCIHYEIANSLADFFVRRTGRLYFNIPSVRQYMKIISDDFVNYFNWDTKRMASEKENMELLLQDATTYYNEDFK
ncbi:glycerol-3-phosphate dehydrogenase/oxidase [Algibacter sp.]|uniref:glycerol-3-phosphate dehydrogenase/oxidase n=1 Tax=Algibacter sp. TaxID=1872428 RepID=UPI0034485076